MRLATLFVVMSLTACATPEQIAARRAYEAEQHQRASEAYTERLASQCEAIGYARQTEGWRRCLMQLHSQNQAHRSQMQGIILNNALQQQRDSMPYCSNLVPGLRGYHQAQGTCR